MTSNLFASFRAFCASEGLDPDVLASSSATTPTPARC